MHGGALLGRVLVVGGRSVVHPEQCRPGPNGTPKGHLCAEQILKQLRCLCPVVRASSRRRSNDSCASQLAQVSMSMSRASFSRSAGRPCTRGSLMTNGGGRSRCRAVRQV